MLFASLAFVAVGLYRCSAEMTAVEEPGTVGILGVSVDVPDSLLAVPADSVAAVTARRFATFLSEASGASVSAGSSEEAWAVVRLHLGIQGPGRVELTATASSVMGGRRIGSATASGPPDSLREMSASVATEIADLLDIGSASPDGDAP
jgi:hypothetical protein